MMKRCYGISQASCVRLISFGVPLVLLLATSYLAERSDLVRDLDFVELFAGEGQLSQAMTAAGLSSARYEIKDSAANNILSTAGFFRAVRLILRLRHGGLVWSGTPCSSWTFMNRGTSRRSAARPLGDEGQPTVTMANVIVARVTLLLMLAIARGASWSVEQPMSSLMELHPRLVQLRGLCACLTIKACWHIVFLCFVVNTLVKCLSLDAPQLHVREK